MSVAPGIPSMRTTKLHLIVLDTLSGLFKIVTKTKPMRQVLINLGEAICQTLNAIQQNNNMAHIDPSNLLWTQSGLML